MEKRVEEQKETVEAVKKIIGHKLFGVAVALIVVIVIFSLSSDKFFKYSNFMNILRYVSVYGIAAIGVTMTILVGGLDISIGSIQGLIGVICSLILLKTNNPYLTFAAMVAIGLTVGLINGLIITRGRIVDIIVTMSMMFSLRGLTYLTTQAHAVHWRTQTWLNWLGTGNFGPVPAPVLIFLALIVIFFYFLGNTLFGRRVYAVGGNREAAKLAGINVDAVRIHVYMLSGLLASFAAIILAARLVSGQPNAGIGFEFQVLAGVLLGGISLSGGEGSLLGTLIGVVFFGVLFNGLILLGISSFWQQFFTGIIIILAALADSRMREKKTFSK
jgi:ribose transport system permease protein